MGVNELAEAALRLKNDEGAKEVLTMLRDAATRRWEQARTTQAREEAWQDRQAVLRFEHGLQTLIDRGTVERITEERASAR